MSSTESWRNPRPTPNLDEVRQRLPLFSFIPPWLRAWWPALLWSAVIFSASTDTFSSAHTSEIVQPVLRWLIPSISQERIDLIHFFIRKSAHFIEYFIFFLLLYRGIRGARRGWHWSWAFAAWFVAAAYSALDEIHQSFVASRTASAWDSLLDSTGALFALFVLFLIYRCFPSSHVSRVGPSNN
jgi:VanZ family protein